MANIPPSSFQGPLAPKMGLGDSFRSPLHENQEKNQPASPSGGRGISKLVPFGAIALALLVLPLTISQLNQQQDLRQRASGPAPTIVLPTETIAPSPTITPTSTNEGLASPSATPEIIEGSL